MHEDVFEWSLFQYALFMTCGETGRIPSSTNEHACSALVARINEARRLVERREPLGRLVQEIQEVSAQSYPESPPSAGAISGKLKRIRSPYYVRSTNRIVGDARRLHIVMKAKPEDRERTYDVEHVATRIESAKILLFFWKMHVARGKQSVLGDPLLRFARSHLELTAVETRKLLERLMADGVEYLETVDDKDLHEGELRPGRRLVRECLYLALLVEHEEGQSRVPLVSHRFLSRLDAQVIEFLRPSQPQIEAGLQRTRGTKT